MKHSASSKQNKASQPTIFDLSKSAHKTLLKKLHKAGKILTIVDDFEEQLKELYAINNPTKVYQPDFAQNFLEFLNIQKKQSGGLEHKGKWVYFPWNGALVHILNNEDFQRVRTARNRYLINEEEQQKFYNSVIGIGGLSVGNSVILAIVLQGGAKHIKLADFDNLALSNLNRIRGSVTALGLNKVEMTARQIYEINPYVKIELFPEGLTEKNLNKFFSSPKIDIIIDELDNIAIKHLVRQYARKYKVPLVMGADNGDNAVVDIERYDQKNKIKFFHGRIGDISYEELKNLDKFGIGKTITKHIGPENIGERMQNSLLSMGKTIVSWPQLGGAALLNGSAVAYCVRKILNDQPLEHNRAIVSLDELFTPGYNSSSNQKARKKIADSFKKIFGLK